MTFIIGIDGGGSGCRAAVADRDGAILGEALSGPANIASDRMTARENILQAARDALARARIGLGLGDLVAGLGLAGANAAGAADWLSQTLPFAQSHIETDAVTATLGALGDQDGIVAALGTGSVFTRRQGNKIRQFGGWGLILGDEGSGAWIGRAALTRTLRAFDGREEMTPWLGRILDRFGGTAGLVGFAQSARPLDFAALAPEILAEPDAAAQAIAQTAVQDVERMLQHIGVCPDMPVSFIGGLGPAFATRLPGLPQRPARGTALDGALCLARGGR